MLLTIGLLLLLIVGIVRALMRGPLPPDTEYKIVETYSRVPWVSKHMSVPTGRTKKGAAEATPVVDADAPKVGES